ncbi:MAG: RNA polymerase sigma factor [Bacteroidales bacterium]
MFIECETEIKLVEGCVRNDRKAQKQLYYKYCNAMYAIAFRIIKNEDDANDALQDAFIQIFKDIKSFRGESTIGAWIKTIVIRAALKKIKKNVFIENIDDSAHNIPDQQSCTLTSEYIEKTILSLPAGYRTVFLLIEVEGYTHKEVAEMMHISEGTSKSQLFYAKKHLRELLKELVY